MDKFKEHLLRTKQVSVWGIGYLGYTTILKLQSMGFTANIFDITDTGFDEKRKRNDFPGTELIHSWSESGNVPPIDYSKLYLADIDAMFNSQVHIFAFPVFYKGGKSLIDKMTDLFVKQKEKLDDKLIIFLSAGPPGTIERHIVDVLRRNNVNCSIATAFRNDWTVEEFLRKDKKRVLAGNDVKSLSKIEFFYDMLGIKYKTLSSIKEAEIYENARNGIQYATTVFINQLALAYQGTNIRAMTEYLLEDVELNESHLSIGAGGYKMPYFIQSILDGSQNPHALSLIQEVHNINLSMILMYAEKIKKRGIKSVTILGLSVRGNQKDIALSPAVILAEYLSKSGMMVCIDDPFYDKESLSEILPACKSIDIFKDKLEAEALFVMTDHNKYKYITQEDIDSLGINKIPLIIDNIALFKNFKFNHSTVYHAIGDGNLRF